MPIFDQMKDGQGSAEQPQDAAPKGDQDAVIFEKVKPVIEALRQFLQADGGDVELVKVEDGVVYVELVGACVGCPCATVTLKRGIEARLRQEVPEIVSVEAI